MMNLFLKAKHWQLFTLMVGLPVGVYIYFVINLVGLITAQQQMGNDIAPESIIAAMKPLFLFMIIPILVMIGWLYSLGKGVQKFIKPELKLKTTFFTITALFPLFYFVGVMFLMFSIMDKASQDLDFEPAIGMVAIIPLNLISMGCMFYNMYFIARSVKTAELQRDVKFGDYVGEFFLLWFYFIGVWIIQPKVNQMDEPVLGDLMNELHD